MGDKNEKLSGAVPNCNRVEVIDENGRSYVNIFSNSVVEISMQDDGRTMKIFISKK